MHISHTKSFNIPVSIALATLAHMINVYDICLNTTNYPIFNMQDFRYCLWTSILDCFGQLVSPPWRGTVQVASAHTRGHLVVTDWCTFGHIYRDHSENITEVGWTPVFAIHRRGRQILPIYWGGGRGHPYFIK